MCLAGALAFGAIKIRFPGHSPGPFTNVGLCTDADSRECVEESKRVHEPQHDTDNDDRVQDGLDGSLHRNETIHEPQQNAHDDQGQ